jgi:hypothetical protein
MPEKALLALRVGGILGWRIHVESYRWPIASVGKFVLCARGDTHKIANLHQRSFTVDLRRKLALDHQEHLVTILVSLRLLAGGLSRPEFHHSNLTAFGSFQDFEPLGFPKYVRAAHPFLSGGFGQVVTILTASCRWIFHPLSARCDTRERPPSRRSPLSARLEEASKAAEVENCPCQLQSFFR